MGTKFVLEQNTLYLVTDSDLLSRSATCLEAHVEQAILGGVDVVQIREKTTDTGAFIDKARTLLAVCQKHAVPLIVNDRVDVALAIGADGVHIGQDDMSCREARRLLGPSAIIGVSVNNVAEAEQAVEAGADYLGIGAVYDTATKALTKPTLGTSGVQEILEHLSRLDHKVQTVAIGGINAFNIDRVMFSSASETQALEGVAVVSAIMTSSEPQKVARGLKELMTGTPAFNHPQVTTIKSAADARKVVHIISQIRMQSPVIQQMTNNVVKNFSANVTIAIGASPIMSEVREEVTDLAKINGGFLLNMGMIGDIDTPLFATQQNNRFGKPTLLDPVGAGATQYRRAAVRKFLDNAYFDVVKGNESELKAVMGIQDQQKGVDNSSVGDLESRCALARALARKLKNVVVMTGVQDVVADATRTVIVRSGSKWLGEITGSGCALGSVITSCLAVSTADKFSAALAGVALYGIAAESAATKDSVHGPGTFLPAFVDCLHDLTIDVERLRVSVSKNRNLLEFC